MTAQAAEPAPAAPAAEPAPAAPAAELGYQDASRIIAAQHAAGVSLDEIAAHHQDVAAWLHSDAQTAVGRAYAREYGETADSLVSELRQDASRREGAAPMAASLPDGTPHADPQLAAKGWHAERGIYTRREPEAIADREAC